MEIEKKIIIIGYLISLSINLLSLFWNNIDKEEIYWIFIPPLNLIYTIFSIIGLKDKILDYMIKNKSEEFYIKKYKGFFYVKKYDYYITYKEVTRLNYGDCYTDINGFLIPYSHMKLICFETKKDTIAFIERLEGFEVLEKLNYF